MKSAGSYDKHASHRNVSAEIKRLAGQARLGWDKESRTLSWYGLKDGMSVLELGSGPGFITAQILELVPNSQVTCLEIDTSLIKQAKEYLQDKDSHRVRYIEGSVMDTQLEKNQFDVAYARFLFQHLRDPIDAAKEIWRVLKPGGKLVIHDIDDGLFGIFQPPIPELSLVIEKFGQSQTARGGNRKIGRDLWRILDVAGFCNIDLEMLASHSGNVGIEPFLEQIDPDRLQPLVEMEFLSERELEQFRASRARFRKSPEAAAFWLSMMICGQKPQ